MPPSTTTSTLTQLLCNVCLGLLAALTAGCDSGGSSDATTSAAPPPLTSSEQACVNQGWNRALFKIDNIDRKVMWKSPGAWSAGTIVILHGGGGNADDFCTGGALVQPQIAFANLAIQQGFAVFALDSTDNQVTDAMGRPCGKRFDFAVNMRPNIDLPYIEHVLTTLIPTTRPSGSNSKIFMTGLSTGGYMTTRAATHFDGLIAAFAPISAGDPYGTDPVCDPALSSRDATVGILVDRETGLEIVQDNSCLAPTYPNESPWETQAPATKPTFRQLQHQKDGIVDFSCAVKANLNLVDNGYVDAGAFVLDAMDSKNPLYHLWLNAYNQPLLNFFLNQ